MVLQPHQLLPHRNLLQIMTVFSRILTKFTSNNNFQSFLDVASFKFQDLIVI